MSKRVHSSVTYRHRRQGAESNDPKVPEPLENFPFYLLHWEDFKDH